MRLLFIDGIGWQYTLNTPYEAPLGGTQSALCYLAEQLQQRGHEVWLFNNTRHIECIRHVPHLPLAWLTLPFLEQLKPDIAIILNSTLGADQLRLVLPPQTPLLLWAHHAADQPDVESLRSPEHQEVYERIVLISQWQQEQYIEAFKIPAEKTAVLRNAIAPCFENLFDSTESILKAKAQPWTLAYTSTPFRGLNLLLDLMPALQVSHPSVRLNVYSSMKVYQASESEDQQEYGNLYQRCHDLANVNYVGSLRQPELAQALKSTAIWAYTNTFPETSCIAAMEAMASGCYLITSELGALPETTAGFADLIPIPQENYLADYSRLLNRAIQRFNDPQAHAALEAHLRAQVDYINHHCTWSVRAREWEAFLEQVLTESVPMLGNWQHRLCDYLEQQRYEDVLAACETLSKQFPGEHGWVAYQGATYIFQGQESEAQLLWSVYLSDFTEEEQAEMTATWAAILLELANLPRNTLELRFALTSYAYEFSPNLKIGLKLLNLSLQLKLGTQEITQLLHQLTALLPPNGGLEEINPEDVVNTVQRLVGYSSELEGLPEFIKALGQYPSIQPSLERVVFELLNNDPARLASTLAEPFLKIAREKWGLYEFLCRACAQSKLHELALDCANRLFDYSLNPLGEDLSLTSKLHVMQTFKYNLNYSEEVMALCERWLKNADRCNQFLAENINTEQSDFGSVFYVICSYFHLTHQFDAPAIIKPIYNKRNQIFYDNAHSFLPVQNRYGNCQPAINSATKTPSPQKIKVGFIGSCFHEHPAGHQMRSFIRLYDRQRFEFYAYNPWSATSKQDQLSYWFQASFDHFHHGETKATEIAEQIYEDKIDLLIDLDSCTSDITYQVLTLKPAPVQATWIGFDAIGLPAVDYFIVDPYILPEGAQAWYTETLWRLPECYLSLDGYEVANKTGIRDQLGLSADAVVFLCAQRTSKIQPEMLKLQFAIVEAVPNAVLVVKYHRGSPIFEEWCRSLAEAEGFDLDKLYFLTSNLPEIHRANLYDVDVVLDTYPYAGGAMSLEALWLEVPLVTKVGQQFVARHTYTFLKNVGVEEGIAFTDEEYVHWGIRFGTEPHLRQQVSWKLRQAKRHAPLWNPQRFSRQMEQALTAMINRYRTGEWVVPAGHRVGE
ncbi:glycosyl transferase family 41 [Thermosynechococcus sp. NK55a]|jgi:predicted O-linked N-acetylglucosamine transferase (SPINDLY family)/glycosyltransferase involved in cell wall biosynthesis|uniref:O-linked N-acetylglucosamine transferase family protein n=1 Tax=Thermosynechococcus sp. NK55a TaxID=1394889 RepID=UPI0003D7FA52|nr:glycosyltransferase [Thermosynechococcus sp. NK55a]AHB87414.1 glycosyl transferase family 41 [Thermosynechococcus sp. NK55a]